MPHSPEHFGVLDGSIGDALLDDPPRKRKPPIKPAIGTTPLTENPSQLTESILPDRPKHAITSSGN